MKLMLIPDIVVVIGFDVHRFDAIHRVDAVVLFLALSPATPFCFGFCLFFHLTLPFGEGILVLGDGACPSIESGDQTVESLWGLRHKSFQHHFVIIREHRTQKLLQPHEISGNSRN